MYIYIYVYVYIYISLSLSIYIYICWGSQVWNPPCVVPPKSPGVSQRPWQPWPWERAPPSCPRPPRGRGPRGAWRGPVGSAGAAWGGRSRLGDEDFRMFTLQFSSFQWRKRLNRMWLRTLNIFKPHFEWPLMTFDDFLGVRCCKML